eukprot:CAMPEP_0196191284 /NCGR_PEP_ID=MMETSP0911-20130528/47909_1 /TAXON_ID=49265 /ORGANISM="Thalassiosira rotula, Strain GSO102" /LENGTH=73 /DNA_ID=CAMNT_0041463327 /DNA_START=62 /DNA_END=283 /DNA_ORIENTATION=-
MSKDEADMKMWSEFSNLFGTGTLQSSNTLTTSSVAVVMISMTDDPNKGMEFAAVGNFLVEDNPSSKNRAKRRN